MPVRLARILARWRILWDVSSAALDRLLAALVAGLAVTGGLSLTFGSPSGGWLFLLHDVLAGLLAVAVAAKLRVSVPRAVRSRRWARLVLAGIVSVVAVGSL